MCHSVCKEYPEKVCLRGTRGIVRGLIFMALAELDLECTGLIWS